MTTPAQPESAGTTSTGSVSSANPNTAQLTGATDDAADGGLFQVAGGTHGLSTVEQQIDADATAAETAKNTAETKAGEAQASATAAAASATAASDDADDAEAAKTAAETAQGAAESARDTAQGYRNTAEDHKDDAETAKAAAETARDTTVDYKNDAKKLAINAEDTQFTLSDSVTTGYSALHHKEKALDAQTAAEGARDTAQGYRDSANTSAGTASTHATTATNAKNDAQKIATTAKNTQYTLSDNTTGYSAKHFKELADDAQTAAESAKDDAETAQSSAESAETNAQNSANDAQKLATNPEDNQYTLADGTTTGYSALHYHNKALASKNAAATSETNAATSESNASDDADDAEKLAINAEDSQYTLSDGTTTGYSALHHAAKALASKNAAATSESNASSSEGNASSSATTATNAKNDAQKLATQAEDSQYTLSDGSTTGYSALHYNAKALASKNAAATSESNAASSESNASTSASSASTSASAASTSASAASSSATSAAASASSASSAQSAAESARDSALAAYDNFDDRYLGVKSSDPTTDNDGDALVAGALYYSSTDTRMKLYNGSAWVDAYVTGSNLLYETTAGTKSSGDLTFNDSVKAKFGTDAELEIFHDGSNSRIKDVGEGSLLVSASFAGITNADGTKDSAKFFTEGAVELRHDGGLRLTTTTDGAKVTTGSGDTNFTIEADSDNTGPETDNPSLILSQDGGSTVSKLRLGSDNDTVLEAHTNGDLFLNNTAGDNYLQGINNGAVKLYYNDVKKFETTSFGAKVDDELRVSGSSLGTTAGDKETLAKFRATEGNTADLDIFVERDTAGSDWTTAYTRIQQTIDATNMAYIQFNGTGKTYGLEIGSAADDEKYATFARNGAVELYNNGYKRFETTTYGSKLTGDTFQILTGEASGNPIMYFTNNHYTSGTFPVDYGGIGTLQFEGKNSANELVAYNRIKAVTLDITDGTEDGRIQFEQIANGTFENTFLFDATYFYLMSDQDIVWYNYGGNQHLYLNPRTINDQKYIDSSTESTGYKRQVLPNRSGMHRVVPAVYCTQDLAVGWYTVAVLQGRDDSPETSNQRMHAKFTVVDERSGRHQAFSFIASAMFKNDPGLVVLGNSAYGNDVVTSIRLKTSTDANGLYAGVAVQVYVAEATNALAIHLDEDDLGSGYHSNASKGNIILKTGIADATDPGDLGYSTATYSTFTEAVKVNIEEVAGGGIGITGNLKIENGKDIIFEGSSDDSYETKFQVTNATGADRIITFPDASGNVVLSKTNPVSGTTTGRAPDIGVAVHSPVGENTNTFQPFLHNDLANFVHRGGTVSFGGLSSNPSAEHINKMFDATGDFCFIDNADITGSDFTITLTDLPKTFKWISKVAIQFNTNSFAGTSCLIETSTDGGTNWTSRLNDSSRHHTYLTSFDTQNTATNAIRFTIGKHASGDIRIGNIVCYNYQSNGMEDYFVSKAGGSFLGDVSVDGLLSATTKSFDIEHPTQSNMRLRYACLEGPENAVYVRGRSSSAVIKLPDYWKGLVHENSITVQITPVGGFRKYWVQEVSLNSIKINSFGLGNFDYFYTIYGERKDVSKLEVEYSN